MLLNIDIKHKKGSTVSKFEDTLVIQEQEKEAIELVNQWLPSCIIDAHFHSSPGTQPKVPLVNDQARVPGASFNFFPWELHKQLLSIIFPRVFCRILAFGFPHIPANNNDYLAQLADHYPISPIFLASNQDDPILIKSRLMTGFNGLKMYPNQRQKASRETTVSDVFPHTVLKVTNELHSAIILHLPRDIFSNLDELLALAQSYNRMTFVLAHMGNVYAYSSDLAKAYQTMARCPNICLDTAMVADPQVIAEAIAQIGSQRVIFGTDAPFSYIRGRHIDVGGHQTKLQSQFHFSWISAEDYQAYQKEASSFRLMHLEIILAIKSALDLLTLNQNATKMQIFWANANNAFRRRKLS